MLKTMAKLRRQGAIVATALLLTCAGISPANAGVVKNELGMYTVKCQVVSHGPGNPIVGLVYGNHKNHAKKAEEDANQYVGKFGSNVHKRHCYTQPRYKNSGTFTVNGDPI